MSLDTSGAPGYGPIQPPTGLLGVAYEQPQEDMVLPPAFMGVFPRDVAGEVLRATFPRWNDGDVLEVDLSISPVAAKPHEQGGATEVIALALVSLDNGVTFDALATSQLRVAVGGAGRSVASLRVFGNIPPIVLVAYSSDGEWECAGARSGIGALGTVTLKVSRSSSNLIDQGPYGELIQL